MEETLVAIYSSLAAFAFITVVCGLIGAVGTSVNGIHASEPAIVHVKHMLDGAVMAIVLSFILMPLMSYLNIKDEMKLVVLFITSLSAPGSLRYLKTKGVGIIKGFLENRGK